MKLTLSQQLDKIYLWSSQQKELADGAEFLKGFLIKYDVIKNNTKVKRGTTTHKTRKQTAVLQSPKAV